MKRNIVTLLMIVLIITVLGVLGMIFIKPDYNSSQKNPYDLKIDSIGRIPNDKFCDSGSSQIIISLNEAIAIAVDQQNNIIVSGDSSILILNSSGEKIGQFKTEKTVTALAIDAEGKIYAAVDNHVSVFSSQGKLLTNWKIFNEDSYLTSIAIKDGFVAVADANQALVYVYKNDGTYLNTIGTPDKKDELSCFILPSYYFDVAFKSDISLWVANTGKHKLVNFNIKGEMLSYWGETSSEVEGFCGCCNPSHFAIMSDGSFITAEKGIVRVKKYDSNGNFKCAIAGPDTFMEGSSGLDLCINSDNQILVLEPAALKIHVFTLNGTDNE